MQFSNNSQFRKGTEENFRIIFISDLFPIVVSYL